MKGHSKKERAALMLLYFPMERMKDSITFILIQK